MPDTAVEVSKALDIISPEPGAILYRGPDWWEALPPGNPGQILVVDADGFPEWQDPD